jgi:methionyl-tRNA formyltransferase
MASHAIRIFFLGGFSRGLRLLDHLILSHEQVVGACVFPEDPHEELQMAPRLVARCQQAGIPVQPTRQITPEILGSIRQANPDVIFCLGWRRLFPTELFDIPRLGVIAAHDSLLPRLRGFAPTSWGLLLGHDPLGVTLFRMTEQVDSGPIYFQQSFPADPSLTFAAASDQIAEISVSLFDRYLQAVRAGNLTSREQSEAEATYGCARAPDDGVISWAATTAEITRLVRALGPPGPGARTTFQGGWFRILEAQAVAHPNRYEGRIPGRIVARDEATGTVDVLTGDGIVRISSVQTDDGVTQLPANLFRSVRDTLGTTSCDTMHLYQQVAELTRRIQALEARDAARSERS